MDSAKPRGAATPGADSNDYGLLAPDAGLDPAQAQHSVDHPIDSNDALHDDENVDQPGLDPARADYSTGDRQIITANLSAG